MVPTQSWTECGCCDSFALRWSTGHENGHHRFPASELDPGDGRGVCELADVGRALSQPHPLSGMWRTVHRYNMQPGEFRFTRRDTAPFCLKVVGVVPHFDNVKLPSPMQTHFLRKLLWMRLLFSRQLNWMRLLFLPTRGTTEVTLK